jgi:hypothetical protein
LLTSGSASLLLLAQFFLQLALALCLLSRFPLASFSFFRFAALALFFLTTALFFLPPPLFCGGFFGAAPLSSFLRPTLFRFGLFTQALGARFGFRFLTLTLLTLALGFLLFLLTTLFRLAGASFELGYTRFFCAPLGFFLFTQSLGLGFHSTLIDCSRLHDFCRLGRGRLCKWIRLAFKVDTDQKHQPQRNMDTHCFGPGRAH